MLWLMSLACTIEPHVPTPPARGTDEPAPSASDPPTDTAQERMDTDEERGLDADGDGYATPLDCDDEDASVHPGATELVADGVDQDCDATELCFRDADLDGFGTQPAPTEDLTCTLPGFASVSGDCDDTSETTHPGAPDTPGGADEDCDGEP